MVKLETKGKIIFRWNWRKEEIKIILELMRLVMGWNHFFSTILNRLCPRNDGIIKFRKKHFHSNSSGIMAPFYTTETKLAKLVFQRDQRSCVNFHFCCLFFLETIFRNFFTSSITSESSAKYFLSLCLRQVILNRNSLYLGILSLIDLYKKSKIN